MSGAKPWSPDEVIRAPFDLWDDEETFPVRFETPSGHQATVWLRPWTMALDVELEAKGLPAGRDAKTPKEIIDQWKIAGPRVVAGWEGLRTASGTEIPYTGPQDALTLARWRWLLVLLRARALVAGDGLVADALGESAGGAGGTPSNSGPKPVS